jgi:MYXO-CTERM domain-containing protein
VRILLIAIAVALVATSPAQAQGVLDRAADTLKLDPVYVDPSAEQAISDDEAEDLRAQILERDAGPLYIAILPADAANESGGDPASALREIAGAVGEPGVYAGVVGDAFRAGTVGPQLPPGRAGELARAALEDHRPDGAAAVLEDFVGRVGRARADAQSGSSGEDEGGGFPWVLAALGAGALALFGVSRRRRIRQAEAEFAEVKSAARDEVIALGEEIRALDLDVEMPGVDPDAKRHYGLAVERYQEAEQALEGARRPEQLRPVSELLEEGRWAMLAARAKLAGETVPERRAPCFFDPRHGPSVTDVDWAPAGGEPRPVPVCAADAVRVEEGEDPDSREVSVGGRQVPYWQAGPAFGPFAGGFFAGGLVPGLLLGSMLGGGLGMFGEEAQAGDFGGDFGGGDFGGGDFGGGDFGGGGDF